MFNLTQEQIMSWFIYTESVAGIEVKEDIPRGAVNPDTNRRVKLPRGFYEYRRFYALDNGGYCILVANGDKCYYVQPYKLDNIEVVKKPAGDH